MLEKMEKVVPGKWLHGAAFHMKGEYDIKKINYYSVVVSTLKCQI